MGRSYHKSGNVWKLGYTDTQLSETLYRVSYTGHGIPQSECDDYAILRAAEIAKKGGFSHFRILDESHSMQSRGYYVPEADAQN